MGVYFRESVYRYRCTYIFLSLNNVCGLSKVFLCTSFIPHNIQVKSEFIISHFLLKDKTEAQGNSIIDNNITKKLKLIVHPFKLFTSGTM